MIKEKNRLLLSTAKLAVLIFSLFLKNHENGMTYDVKLLSSFAGTCRKLNKGGKTMAIKAPEPFRINPRERPENKC